VTLRALLFSAVLLGISSCCWAAGPQFLDAAVRSFTKGADAPAYRYALADLNKDGRPDAIVLLKGDYCGTGGCTLLVFRAIPNGFKLVSSSTVSSEPIGLLSERSNGWLTLVVNSRGSGSVLMRFDGTKYPLNPSMQSVATKDQASSATILKFEDAGSSVQ
jgi:hypothetical protein